MDDLVAIRERYEQGIRPTDQTFGAPIVPTSIQRMKASLADIPTLIRMVEDAQGAVRAYDDMRVRANQQLDDMRRERDEAREAFGRMAVKAASETKRAGEAQGSLEATQEQWRAWGARVGHAEQCATHDREPDPGYPGLYCYPNVCDCLLSEMPTLNPEAPPSRSD